MVGKSVGDTPFNTDEVQAIKYSHPSDILKEMEQDVEKFTPWFVILMQNHWKKLKNIYESYRSSKSSF